MLKKERMNVIQNKRIAEDTYELKLTGELVNEMTDPGQFLHVQIGEGWEHVLRRPLSITNVENNEATVIYKIVGDGTREITKLETSDTIDVLGPRGNGFPIEGVYDQHVLLVGGGVGVPPLYYLARKLKDQGNRITTVLGFQTKSAVFYEEQFSQLGDCYIATDDGSHGSKGRVTTILNELDNSMSRYYSCGPIPMLNAVSSELTMPGYLSLEERMGCGIGACFACVCKTQDTVDHKGYRKICQDGPVFQAGEVVI